MSADSVTTSCPVCKQAVAAAPGARPDSFPFCTARCRKIDLGQWLGEGYRIPTRERAPGDGDAGPGDDED